MILFVIKCFYSDSSESIFTSPVANHKKYGNKSHEVKMRSVMAFREFLKFSNCQIFWQDTISILVHNISTKKKTSKKYRVQIKRKS